MNKFTAVNEQLKTNQPSSWMLMLTLLLILLTGCSSQSVPSTNIVGDSIYFGGSIITINEQQPSAEALVVAKGNIIFVGSLSQAMKLINAETKQIDLRGKTLLPGFIDGHSHFSAVGLQSVVANLLPPPDGPVQNIEKLKQVMRDYIKSSPLVAEYGVAFGLNYDDSQLQEKRHPTRYELDQISTEIPIVLIHQSGHIGVYNSKALQLLGVDSNTPIPDGGIMQLDADGVTPSGVMQEKAHFDLVFQLIPKFTPTQFAQILKQGEQRYLANGFTTVQDGKTDVKTLRALSALAATGIFGVDIVSYIDMSEAHNSTFRKSPLLSKKGGENFRIGGLKFTLDGSPQAKTAWFTLPYLVTPKGQNDEFSGYAALTDDEITQSLLTAYQENIQVLIHANGDAAIDQLIKVVTAARKQLTYKQLQDNTDHRTVLIHGQFMRKDQVAKIKAMGVFPSVFPMHTFYWGDWHRTQVSGNERAANISPTAWLLEENVKFSIHSDAPVLFPDSMKLISTAVNRTTRTGVTLGLKHRLSPIQAIKALTIWPAVQYFEEDMKGSLEVGKIADFVILDKNPLQVKRSEIDKIQVLSTIKAGKVLFEK